MSITMLQNLSPALPNGEVHVWMRVPAEPEKILRPRPEEARAWDEACQRDLRMVLCKYGENDKTNLVFERGPFGKPFLPGGSEFNLSHTNGAMAVAVSSGEVGVDIERVGRKTSWKELARRHFFSEEIQYLEKFPDPAAAFLEFWTCKEAICKLAGEGIYRGLKYARIHSADTDRGSYRGKEVHLKRFGHEFGITGTVACWEPFAAKGFVIGPKSAIMTECLFKI